MQPVIAVALAILLFVFSLSAQMRHSTAAPDPHQHIYAIVPMIGSGTAADPKRPMFVPANGFPAAIPIAKSTINRTGIIGYHAQITDDGKDAIVEFVAPNISAFQELLTSHDSRVVVFQKGIHPTSAMEAAFKSRKKDFSFATFHMGVR